MGGIWWLTYRANPHSQHWRSVFARAGNKGEWGYLTTIELVELSNISVH